MGIVEAIKNGLKEAFASIQYGGVAASQVWKTDEALRATVELKASMTQGRQPIEGDLFLGDMKEFYEAMDRYNATQPAAAQFRVMLHEDIAKDIPSALLADRTSLLGFSCIEGIALERHGRVYTGRWFSDMAERSGFAFTMAARETNFLCGLEKKTEFKNFVAGMFSAPVYHATMIPR